MSQDFHPNVSPDHFWMPFTANRQFKATPRLLESAEGMYYTASDGRQAGDERRAEASHAYRSAMRDSRP